MSFLFEQSSEISIEMSTCCSSSHGLTSFTDCVSTRAERYCRHATHISISGANSPTILHLKYLTVYCVELSPGLGKSRWIADQTHNDRVSKQVNSMLSVPRPSGESTKPTRVSLVEVGRGIEISTAMSVSHSVRDLLFEGFGCAMNALRPRGLPIVALNLAVSIRDKSDVFDRDD